MAHLGWPEGSMNVPSSRHLGKAGADQLINTSDHPQAKTQLQVRCGCQLSNIIIKNI